MGNPSLVLKLRIKYYLMKFKTIQELQLVKKICNDLIEERKKKIK